MFFLLHAEIKHFIFTCVLLSRLTKQCQRFRKVSHSQLHSLAIHELQLVDLAQYKCGHEDYIFA